MDLSLEETITVLASSPGLSSRGIVRLSGPRVCQIVDEWFIPRDQSTDSYRQSAAVHRGVLRVPELRALVPAEAYLWPTRSRYTGQPLVEFHLPGSPPLIEAVLLEATRRGTRPARPGEFTLRAFLSGKIDLLQAEAVLGVIDAHDHIELQTALSQLAGGISGQLVNLRRDLLDLLADLEAGLDFVEEDIEFVSRCELTGRVALARQFLEKLLQQSSGRMQSLTRPRVVLAGLPNAGKSTLFNKLAGSESAIVSQRKGTTRDFLAVPVDWKGMTIDLVDTAGWELNVSGISEESQRQRAEQLHSADLIIWCTSAADSSEMRELDQKFFTIAASQSRSMIRVLTQSDRLCRDHAQLDQLSIDGMASNQKLASEHSLVVSAVTGVGLDALAEAMSRMLVSSSNTSRQWLGVTATRCSESLEAVAASLAHAEESAGIANIGDELLAVDLREALDHLGRVLGAVYTEDILDRVFSKFCIGK